MKPLTMMLFVALGIATTIPFMGTAQQDSDPSRFALTTAALFPRTYTDLSQSRGRFQIVANSIALSGTILLDTATGRSWSLCQAQQAANPLLAWCPMAVLASSPAEPPQR
jgi:hypothetical protein